MTTSFLVRAGSGAMKKCRKWDLQQVISAACEAVPEGCFSCSVESKLPSGSVHTGKGRFAPWLIHTKIKTLAAEWPQRCHLFTKLLIESVVGSVTLYLIPTILKTLIINSSFPSLPTLTHARQRGVNVYLNYTHNCLFFPLAWACSESVGISYHQEVVAFPLTSLFYHVFKV